ncbi:hypothetical protein [Bdellovibrio bacteriovorus]|uniref:hypothetical protein n=1 Tax=Bdellovibrio bacteriovorus TaxID=959 RepID=UPI0012DACD31|nr:hypothetical protein [Bdellovibrio bacteriovorus]
MGMKFFAAVFCFSSLLLSASPSLAGEACGSMTCRDDHYCERKNNLVGKLTETCKPIPNFAATDNTSGNSSQALAECRRTCQSPNVCNADNSERTSYSCRAPEGNRTNGNNAPTCNQQFQQLMQACTSQIEDTSYTCDEKNDSGMAEVTNTASQLALLMGQQTSASIQAACSKMASLSQAANAAVAAYRLTCSNSIGSCKSACGAAKTYAQQQATCLSAGNAALAVQLASQADTELKRCDSFENKVNEANQAISNFGTTSANASQCAALTSGEEKPTPEFCAANPTYPSCVAQQAVDCTNPTIATTNKVCICQKNPMDPACVSAQKAGDGGSVASMIDSSSRVGAKAGEDSFGGDLGSTPPIEHGQLPSGGAGQAIDGSQGGGGGSLGGGSGSGGGSYGSAGGGGAASEDGANVNGGFYGGGGGGRSYAGGGGSGEGGPGGIPGAPGSGVPGANGPDLRKFLPGGQFDPRLRGVAGTAGPDGITGPHSNIWMKIQNRYKVMVPSLLP